MIADIALGMKDQLGQTLTDMVTYVNHVSIPGDNA